MMVINLLSAHPCFKTLDPESCGVLDRHCTWLKAAAGAWVVGQTANDRDVYFVMAGRLGRRFTDRGRTLCSPISKRVLSSAS